MASNRKPRRELVRDSTNCAPTRANEGVGSWIDIGFGSEYCQHAIKAVTQFSSRAPRARGVRERFAVHLLFLAMAAGYVIKELIEIMHLPHVSSSSKRQLWNVRPRTPKTIAGQFNKLLTRISPGIRDLQTYGLHELTVKRRLSTVFQANNVVRIGSYSRGSSIRLFSDIDLMMVLK